MLKKILTALVFAVVICIAGYDFWAYTASTRALKPFQYYNTKHEWGEPAKLMFPDITTPSYQSAKQAAGWLKDTDNVFVYRAKSATYVYPAIILGFHHLVNDVIDGKPVLVSACLLSGSSAVYSRTIGKNTYSFGVLGPLLYGNLVMYERTTDSRFAQISGEAIEGKLAGSRLSFVSYLPQTAWSTVKNTKNVRVLAPQKEIAFYREFYEKYKSGAIGMKSLVPYKSPDERLGPYQVGVATVGEQGATFHPINSFLASAQRDITVTQGSVITPVFWYSWSAFFPKTAIK